MLWQCSSGKSSKMNSRMKLFFFFNVLSQDAFQVLHKPFASGDLIGSKLLLTDGICALWVTNFLQAKGS